MARRLAEIVRRNGLALIAVFIALGGSAYALQANSVGSRQIRDGGVKERDLHDGAVSAAKLAPGAVEPPLKIDYKAVSGASFTDILAVDGFHLQAECDGGQTYISAYSTASGASLGWEFQFAGGHLGGPEVGRRIVPGADAPVLDKRIVTPGVSSASKMDATGTLVYREPSGETDATVTSIPLTVSTELTEAEGITFCAIEGTATRATQSSVAG